MNKKKLEGGGMVVMALGLVALDEEASAVLDGCRSWLEGYLSEAFPAFGWVVEKADWEQAGAETLRLLDRAQGEMETRGWQFCFLVSASGSSAEARWEMGEVFYGHSTAVIRLPGPRRSDEGDGGPACLEAVLDCFARLNGLTRQTSETSPAGEDAVPLYGPEEIRAIERSLRSLADGMLKRGVKEVRSAFLYLGIIFSHPMRVLRPVFSRRPLRIVFSLGKLVFAAMAALVLALLSTELWHLGVGMNIWRLILIAVAVLLAATVYVVFQQHLYVSRVSLSLSQQAAIFNIASFMTVLAVFMALFAVIVTATMVITVGVYPRYIVREWLGKAEIDFWDYVRVSLLIASLAMLVGALGAGLEENDHFRRVMYTERRR